MAVFLLAILVAMIVSRRVRSVGAIMGVTLGLWMAWDNVVSECSLPADGLILRHVEASVPDHGLELVAVHLRFDIANRTATYLESVNLAVTLNDCDLDKVCEPLGRKVERVQVLVPAGGARSAETWVRFENVAASHGRLEVQVAVLGGVGDRF